MQTSFVKHQAKWIVALGILGVFVSALVFIIGIAVGVAFARPGGLLDAGASPFAVSPSIAANPAAVNDTTAEQGRQPSLNYALINDVLRRLRTQWYGEMPSSAQLTDGAIKGMVAALGDEFTQYIEPRFARLLNDDISGVFEGIGATLRQTPSGGVQIVRTFPGSPAERGGVLPGDIIEAVNGMSTQGLNTIEVAALVRGPRGSEVTLTLRRAGRVRPFDITLVRERIEIPLVSSRMVGDGAIAYVSLFDFSQPASRQLEKHLKELLDKRPSALIFDLRDNPGGLLSQAQEVGDIFLKQGVLVIERDYRGNKKVTRTTDRGIAHDIPMVGLGQQRLGKRCRDRSRRDARQRPCRLDRRAHVWQRSVQSPQPSPTAASCGSPSSAGIRPMIARSMAQALRRITSSHTPEDLREGKDPQLEAAIAFLTTGKTPPPTPLPDRRTDAQALR